MIDIQKELYGLYPREYVIPEKLLSYIRSVAERAFEEGIDKARLHFRGEVFLENPYKAKEEPGK